MLERIASTEKPPMDLETIKAMRSEFERLHPYDDDDKDDEFRNLTRQIMPMNSTFREGRGDLEAWTPEVLEDIDKCFVATFMENEEPLPCLFSKLYSMGEDNAQMIHDKHQEYYRAVDSVLVRHKDTVPRYAREYFAFYSIWEIQTFEFPVPLVTASVVECLDKIASKVRNGMTEVSISDSRGPRCPRIEPVLCAACIV